MKELEEENTLLKKLYSDVVVQCESAKAELAECKKAAAKPDKRTKSPNGNNVTYHGPTQ
jgi:hypothetical protein